MTATEKKAARRTALRGLKAGDVVRVVRLTESYAREPLATATVIKVLSNAVRVGWAPTGSGTTDFTRDAGRTLGTPWGAGVVMIETA